MKGTLNQVRTARYPLTRYMYIYINYPSSNPLNPVIREFLRYALSREGQTAIEQEGVSLPLPSRIAAQQLAELR